MYLRKVILSMACYKRVKIENHFCMGPMVRRHGPKDQIFCYSVPTTNNVKDPGLMAGRG